MNILSLIQIEMINSFSWVADMVYTEYC